MTRALGEEVTWNQQRVTSTDWQGYRSLKLGIDLPAIETVLINRTEVEACGAGETAITLVAATIGNAIFDATGVRTQNWGQSLMRQCSKLGTGPPFTGF